MVAILPPALVSGIIEPLQFTANQYGIESTIAGFDYDLQFALFAQDSVFDIGKPGNVERVDRKIRLERGTVDLLNTLVEQTN